MSLVQVIGFQPQVLRTIEWLIKKRRQRLSYGKISRVFFAKETVNVWTLINAMTYI